MLLIVIVREEETISIESVTEVADFPVGERILLLPPQLRGSNHSHQPLLIQDNCHYKHGNDVC